MVDIQTASVTVASAGVFAAAIYYIFQIRHQTRLRQTDIIIRLNTQYTSEGFQRAINRVLDSSFEDFDDFVKKYGLYSQNDVLISYQLIGSFFESLGVLFGEKLVDVNLCQRMFSVGTYWEKARPIVIEFRKLSGRPELYEWFEYLYKETKKIQQQQASKKA